jgi:hypothetical protein
VLCFINTLIAADRIFQPPLADNEEVITLGLRVYASKECKVNVKGQLRYVKYFGFAGNLAKLT